MMLLLSLILPNLVRSKAKTSSPLRIAFCANLCSSFNFVIWSFSDKSVLIALSIRHTLLGAAVPFLFAFLSSVHFSFFARSALFEGKIYCLWSKVIFPRCCGLAFLCIHFFRQSTVEQSFGFASPVCGL